MRRNSIGASQRIRVTRLGAVQRSRAGGTDARATPSAGGSADASTAVSPLTPTVEPTEVPNRVSAAPSETAAPAQVATAAADDAVPTPRRGSTPSLLLSSKSGRGRGRARSSPPSVATTGPRRAQLSPRVAGRALTAAGRPAGVSSGARRPQLSLGQPSKGANRHGSATGTSRRRTSAPGAARLTSPSSPREDALAEGSAAAASPPLSGGQPSPTTADAAPWPPDCDALSGLRSAESSPYATGSPASAAYAPSAPSPGRRRITISGGSRGAVGSHSQAGRQRSGSKPPLISASSRPMAPVVHVRIRPLLPAFGESNDLRKVWFLDHENMVVRAAPGKAFLLSSSSNNMAAAALAAVAGVAAASPNGSWSASANANNSMSYMGNLSAGSVFSRLAERRPTLTPSRAKENVAAGEAFPRRVADSPPSANLSTTLVGGGDGSSPPVGATAVPEAQPLILSLHRVTAAASHSRSASEQSALSELASDPISPARLSSSSASHPLPPVQPSAASSTVVSVESASLPQPLSPPPQLSHAPTGSTERAGESCPPAERRSAASPKQPTAAAAAYGSMGRAAKSSGSGSRSATRGGPSTPVGVRRDAPRQGFRTDRAVSALAQSTGGGSGASVSAAALSLTGLPATSGQDGGAGVGKEQHFAFELIYDESATQEEVFEDSVVHFADEALLAQNVTILCYGPTGSGKTYSMMGHSGGGSAAAGAATLSRRTSVVAAGGAGATASSPRPRHRSPPVAQAQDSGEVSSPLCATDDGGGSAESAGDPHALVAGGSGRQPAAGVSSRSLSKDRVEDSLTLVSDEDTDDDEWPLFDHTWYRDRRRRAMLLAASSRGGRLPLGDNVLGRTTDMGILPRLVHVLLDRRDETVVLSEQTVQAGDADARGGANSRRGGSSGAGSRTNPRKTATSGATSASATSAAAGASAAPRQLQRTVSLTLRALTFYGIELYCDEVSDLMDPGKRPITNAGDVGGLAALCSRLDQAREETLASRAASAGAGAMPSRAGSGGGIAVESLEDLRRAYRLARRNRVTAMHAKNDTSSRSHAVFILQLGFELKEREADPATGEQVSQNVRSVNSYVAMVDLAGSERLKETLVESGQALREAQYINKSLSALSSVVLALYQRSSHIPYRDSKLTRLLRPCLEGGRVLVLVHVAPCSGANTLNTLKFADQIRHTLVQTHNFAQDTNKRGLVDIFEDLIDPAQGRLEVAMQVAQQRFDQLCAEVRVAYFDRSVQGDGSASNANSTTSPLGQDGTGKGIAEAEDAGDMPTAARTALAASPPPARPAVTSGDDGSLAVGERVSSTTADTHNLSPSFSSLEEPRTDGGSSRAAGSGRVQLQQQQSTSCVSSPSSAAMKDSPTPRAPPTAAAQRAFRIRTMVDDYFAPRILSESAGVMEAMRDIELERERRVEAARRKLNAELLDLRAKIDEMTTFNAQLAQENTSPLSTDPYCQELLKQVRISTEEVREATAHNRALRTAVQVLRQRLAVQEDIETGVDADVEEMRSKGLLPPAPPIDSPPPPPLSPGTTSAAMSPITGSPANTVSYMDSEVVTDSGMREIGYQQVLLSKDLSALRMETACFALGDGIWEGLWARTMRQQLLVAVRVELALMEKVLLEDSALRALLADVNSLSPGPSATAAVPSEDAAHAKGSAVKQPTATPPMRHGHTHTTYNSTAPSPAATPVKAEGRLAHAKHTSDAEAAQQHYIEAAVSRVEAFLESRERQQAEDGSGLDGEEAAGTRWPSSPPAASLSPRGPGTNGSYMSALSTAAGLASSSAAAKLMVSVPNPLEVAFNTSHHAASTATGESSPSGSIAAATSAAAAAASSAVSAPKLSFQVVSGQPESAATRETATRRGSFLDAIAAACQPMSLVGHYASEEELQRVSVLKLLQDGIPCEATCVGESFETVMDSPIMGEDGGVVRVRDRNGGQNTAEDASAAADGAGKRGDNGADNSDGEPMAASATATTTTTTATATNTITHGGTRAAAANAHSSDNRYSSHASGGETASPDDYSDKDADPPLRTPNSANHSRRSSYSAGGGGRVNMPCTASPSVSPRKRRTPAAAALPVTKHWGRLRLVRRSQLSSKRSRSASVGTSAAALSVALTGRKGNASGGAGVVRGTRRGASAGTKSTSTRSLSQSSSTVAAGHEADGGATAMASDADGDAADSYVLEFVFSHNGIPLPPRMTDAVTAAVAPSPRTELEELVDSLPSSMDVRRRYTPSLSPSASLPATTAALLKERRLFSIPLSEAQLGIELHLLEAGALDRGFSTGTAASPALPPSQLSAVNNSSNDASGGGGAPADGSTRSPAPSVSPTSTPRLLPVGAAPASAARHERTGYDEELDETQVVLELHGIPLSHGGTLGLPASTASAEQTPRVTGAGESSMRSQPPFGTPGAEDPSGSATPASASLSAGAVPSAVAAGRDLVLAKRLKAGHELLLPACCILPNKGHCTIVLRFPSAACAPAARLEHAETIVAGLCGVMRPRPFAPSPTAAAASESPSHRGAAAAVPAARGATSPLHRGSSARAAGGEAATLPRPLTDLLPGSSNDVSSCGNGASAVEETEAPDGVVYNYPHVPFVLLFPTPPAATAAGEGGCAESVDVPTRTPSALTRSRVGPREPSPDPQRPRATATAAASRPLGNHARTAVAKRRSEGSTSSCHGPSGGSRGASFPLSVRSALGAGLRVRLHFPGTARDNTAAAESAMAAVLAAARARSRTPSAVNDANAGASVTSETSVSALPPPPPLPGAAVHDSTTHQYIASAAYLLQQLRTVSVGRNAGFAARTGAARAPGEDGGREGEARTRDTEAAATEENESCWRVAARLQQLHAYRRRIRSVIKQQIFEAEDIKADLLAFPGARPEAPHARDAASEEDGCEYNQHARTRRSALSGGGAPAPANASVQMVAQEAREAVGVQLGDSGVGAEPPLAGPHGDDAMVRNSRLLQRLQLSDDLVGGGSLTYQDAAGDVDDGPEATTGGGDAEEAARRSLVTARGDVTVALARELGSFRVPWTLWQWAYRWPAVTAVCSALEQTALIALTTASGDGVSAGVAAGDAASYGSGATDGMQSPRQLRATAASVSVPQLQLLRRAFGFYPLPQAPLLWSASAAVDSAPPMDALPASPGLTLSPGVPPLLSSASDSEDDLFSSTEPGDWLAETPLASPQKRDAGLVRTVWLPTLTLRQPPEFLLGLSANQKAEK